MKLHHSLLGLLLVLAAACTPSLPPAPTSAPPTPTLTQAATATQTPTVTPLPSPTLPATPAASPTPLPITRQTPMTLMLHRRNTSFDAVTFLADFIEVVKASNLKVVTYRDISANPAITATQQGQLFIFTIDDIYLRYPIDPSVLEMIAMLKAAGYPAVLGIVTEGDYAYPETVATLKELSALGWEVASHSDTHRNLREIQKVSPKGIFPEIRASLDKLEQALGQRPITLILPEGQMTQGDQQLKRAQLQWIVGINGGITYDTDATYYYVGREGPAGDARNTFDIMRKRFKP